LDTTKAETIIVNGFSSKSFTAICRNKEFLNKDLHISSFDHNSGDAVIRMPKVKHEMLHRLLDEEVLRASIAMGIDTEFVTVGCATYEDFNQGSLLWRLEGDSARRPNSARGRDDYPTLVIESGNTQSWGSLKSKARLCSIKRSAPSGLSF
jgi:hypothetical protein